MAIDQGPVSKSGNRYKQITTFEFSGSAGDAPTSYKVRLHPQEFEQFDDGVRILGRSNLGVDVGKIIYDSDGNLIQERVDFMNQFITLMYTIMAEIESGMYEEREIEPGE